MLSEHLCLPHKIVAVLTVPVQQDQRIALALLYEMVRDIYADNDYLLISLINDKSPLDRASKLASIFSMSQSHHFKFSK